ncbi:DNA polymerase III subunit delta' [Cellvibrio sp. KY-GH-1]|uniref:DNA polymerase III subunit delta' n=1 Tax=Cellvibrio sp. KY-GH-1 TaxID=2303332 RepID=UPI001243A490|nr:DNA polymerase III subunit delta' [Cellvibrio sp. KY-GH-1]QEY15254.1 DNA polymerase III subunit delta' [Cellvibrio sp. KY-GH-1]
MSDSSTSSLAWPVHPYPWQLSDWQHLVQQIAAKKLPHALMIAGPKGIGKRHLADALAQLLLCVSPIEGTPCGRCRGCELNKSQTHPDLLWLEPEEAGKAIKVDQVRDLTESLGKTAQQGGYKLVIIEPAEAMNGNAANALLKSLEEPAANTLLILVTHAPSAVLPTIRSRCQMRKLPMPRTEQVLHWLSPLVVGSNITPDALLVAARGAPLTALSLLQGDALEQREQTLQQFVRLTLGQISAIEVAANWHGGEVIALVEWLLGLLHSVARWRAGANDPQIALTPVEWRERISNLNLPLLHRYIEKILVSKRQLLSGANPNKQLLLEELLLDWGALLRASTNRAMASGH